MSESRDRAIAGDKHQRWGTLRDIPDLHFTRHFPPSADSAAGARDLVRQVLGKWELEVLEEQALLLTTELISNGVRHAGTALRLEMSYNGRCLRIGVSDGDRRPPTLDWSGDRSTHGWGLRMVDLLAENWGTTIGPKGKVVWFELPRPVERR